jgi:hypothetical protein
VHIRFLISMAMVRVGGGWEPLPIFLEKAAKRPTAVGLHNQKDKSIVTHPPLVRTWLATCNHSRHPLCRVAHGKQQATLTLSAQHFRTITVNRS